MQVSQALVGRYFLFKRERLGSWSESSCFEKELVLAAAEKFAALKDRRNFVGRYDHASQSETCATAQTATYASIGWLVAQRDRRIGMMFDVLRSRGLALLQREPSRGATLSQCSELSMSSATAEYGVVSLQGNLRQELLDGERVAEATVRRPLPFVCRMQITKKPCSQAKRAEFNKRLRFEQSLLLR